MAAVSPAISSLDDCPVDWKILYRNPATLQGDQSGWRSSYQFLVAAEDHDEFCKYCGGKEVEIDLGGGSSAIRIIPASDPYRDDLLCQRISSTFTGKYTSGNPAALKNWSHAKVTVEFGSVPYPTDGSTPFMTISDRSTPEAVTASGKRLAFGDGTPISMDAAAIIPTTQKVITIYNAPNDRAADHDIGVDFSGTVNSDTVLGIFAPYTLRFDGLDREEMRTATGQTTVRKNLYLTWRYVDLRKAMTGDWPWDFPTKPGGGYIYNAVPYTPLFA